MGWCLLPGGNWEPGWSSEECAAAGGVYSETGPPSNGNGGGHNCFVRTILTRSLAEAILDLGRTYQSAVDFRDEVLGSSPVGKRMIKTYYKYNPAILQIVLGNYELLAESLRTWKSILPFVRATDALATGRFDELAEQHRQLRFNKRVHDRVIRLLDRLRSESEDKGFHAALSDVKEELSRYVGLTPEEALERIRRKPSGGSSKKR